MVQLEEPGSLLSEVHAVSCSFHTGSIYMQIKTQLIGQRTHQVYRREFDAVQASDSNVFSNIHTCKTYTEY